MPFSFITKSNSKVYKKYIDSFSKHLINVEEIDSAIFRDTTMINVGVYDFCNNKHVDNIHITYLDNPDKNVKSLLDIKEFSDYEMEFIQYLEQQGSQDIIPAGRGDKRKKELIGLSDKEQVLFIKNKIINHSKKLKEYFENHINVHALIVNIAYGIGCASALSGKNGQIFSSYEDCERFFLNRFASTGYNVLVFKSKKDAENCKIALQNPLLRFTLYRLQDDQNMYPKVYKYIPDIDWSDPRVVTDEGLLEVCGCPKDKCKEYSDYCKKIIEEVDKKK